MPRELAGDYVATALQCALWCLGSLMNLSHRNCAERQLHGKSRTPPFCREPTRKFSPIATTPPMEQVLQCPHAVSSPDGRIARGAGSRNSRSDANVPRLSPLTQPCALGRTSALFMRAWEPRAHPLRERRPRTTPVCACSSQVTPHSRHHPAIACKGPQQPGLLVAEQVREISARAMMGLPLGGRSARNGLRPRIVGETL